MKAPEMEVMDHRTVAVPPVGDCPPNWKVLLSPEVMLYWMSTWIAAADPGIAAMERQNRDTHRERIVFPLFNSAARKLRAEP